MSNFDIIVVGGGLVGLAAAIGLRSRGHSVQVVEATPSLSVVGDAIAVAANQARVLDYYGILDDFCSRAVKDLGMMHHRKYSTGDVISTRDMKAQEANYKYATYILSRKGYQQFLFDHAERLGVKFHFDSRVGAIEDNAIRPGIRLVNGSRLEADIIVGADGVKSAIRKSIHPSIDLTSRWDCYRAVVPHEKCKADPELAPLLTGINFFMGPQKLIIQSNMTDIGVASLNMYHAGSSGAAGAWKAPGDLSHLRTTFRDFGPPISKMVNMVDECILWKVVEVPPLPSWVSKGGKIVLIGDAAHAMTPHQGQGCAMGIEDGGALTECLGHAKSLEDVPELLKAFEQMRKPRTELIASVSVMLGSIWSMPDGKQQQQRDENMRKTPIWSAGDWDGQPIDKIPCSARDPAYQPWVMAHDAIDFARRNLGTGNTMASQNRAVQMSVTDLHSRS